MNKNFKKIKSYNKNNNYVIKLTGLLKKIFHFVNRPIKGTLFFMNLKFKMAN